MQEPMEKTCLKSLSDSGIDLKEFPSERLKEVFNVLGARSLNSLWLI